MRAPSGSGLAIAVAAVGVSALLAGGAAGDTGAPSVATVVIDPSQVVRSFRTDRALGAALDGHEHGDTRLIYTRANRRAMASAGLGAISYRLRTELGVEAWHWNPAGTWSDPRHRRGYWTSSPTSRRPLLVSYGYSLPRRGDTHDQAEDHGYSRLDDGSLRTFWKSNPYLDARYTGEPNARHPQWALIDLGHHRPVDAIRIAWGTPYAVRFRVERWTGTADALPAADGSDAWAPFPRGSFQGRGGTQTLRLARRALRVRVVRVLLQQGSMTAPSGSRDVRDRLGFAIRELGLGVVDHGRFRDLVRHRPDHGQTDTLTSSTDPWHSASDRDPNTEQPGLDVVLRSGLVRHRPLLVPVAALYGTPANARNELRWLRARRVALRGVEIGEEPDGQLVSPEDYTALYLEVARELRRVDPGVPLGGPGYQTELPDWAFWPDRHGDRSWTRRFVLALRARHALDRLGFFSFEWYPFDSGCAPPGPQVAGAPGMLDSALSESRADGVPLRVPILITELGFSSYATRDEVDLPGALFDADAIGRLLTDRAAAAYMYGLEPDTLISELRCHTFGNLILLRSDDQRHVIQPTAALWAVRLVDRTWAQPGDGRQQLLRTVSAPPLVGSYAVRRPDGRLAIMLVNRDLEHPATVALRAPQGGPLVAGPLAAWTLSRADYRWRPRGERGYARPDAPPRYRRLASGTGTIVLPAASLTVVRTR